MQAKKTVALITNMDIPLGNTIGNSLEVIEAIETLHNNGPKDLTDICLNLAGNMLNLSGLDSLEECMNMAKSSLEDGSAFEKLVEMVQAQGGDISVIKDTNKFKKAPYEKEVLAEKEGYITHMDTEQCGISSLALGAGRETKESSIDYAAGIVLRRKIGDYVKKGDVLASLHTSKEESLAEAKSILLKAIYIDKNKPELHPLIYARVEKDKVEKFI
jgi:pyrimidine-nucleoside phosphorylase